MGVHGDFAALGTADEFRPWLVQIRQRYAECFPGERPHLEIGRRSVELFERRDGFLLACCAASGVTPPHHQSVALLDQQSTTTRRAGLCDWRPSYSAESNPSLMQRPKQHLHHKTRSRHNLDIDKIHLYHLS